MSNFNMVSKIGYIIIFDRYYNASPNGTIDCPNITTGLFSSFERLLYELTPKIDISIYLKTEIDNVVRQNNQRHKIEVESSEEIKHRYNLFEEYDSYAKVKKLLYNNNISLNDLKKLVLLVFTTINYEKIYNQYLEFNYILDSDILLRNHIDLLDALHLKRNFLINLYIIFKRIKASYDIQYKVIFKNGVPCYFINTKRKDANERFLKY